jgi:ABC-2 type transport system ATP-binding protein
MTASIEFQELTMRFQRNGSEPLTALDRLALQIEGGQVFGLLGPNGSGKTTTVNLLCGLLKPTSGRAFVQGVDVTAHVAQVRAILGVVPQETALYNDLTAQENLVFHARLYNVPSRERAARIAEVLELVGLTSCQYDRVGTYSGGMQRRLALARALLTHPDVVVLDEPTLGVDVQSRAALWERIRQIARDGKTVLLTTNYMEEAQALADHLAILDHGQLIANGTPAELHNQLGQTIVELEAEFTPAQRETITKIPGVTEVKWHAERNRAQLVSADGDRAMPEVMTWLQANRTTPRTITMRQPDLNDVFLKLTGRALRD